MTQQKVGTESMHFVTVGAEQVLIENLWERVAAMGGLRFSHIVHPIMGPRSWSKTTAPNNVHFFGDGGSWRLPRADRSFLASLEGDDVPTIHNMILGDRIVSQLNYGEVLAYATLLSRRLESLYESLRPTAIIGAFDLLHGGLAYAVAKKMGIPWYALNFSVIPSGFACFCDGMSPAARVNLREHACHDMRSVAESALSKFVNRQVQAPAYIAPLPGSLAGSLAKLPNRLSSLYRTIGKSRRREYLKFVEGPGGHDVREAWRYIRSASRARSALSMTKTISEPPSAPFVFFGLHLQPESSIDVWAPFFSNQIWVIELLARSIPTTHKLLVKIHKSDVANYSAEQLGRMRSFPSVELVTPFADSRKFIENADLVISIQGTLGLESALLGKPVIMLGESPVTLFPSASRIGKITDLPELVRRKLAEQPPGRDRILEAYSEFLMPFAPVAHNDWTIRPNDKEIAGFVDLFFALACALGAHKDGRPVEELDIVAASIKD